LYSLILIVVEYRPWFRFLDSWASLCDRS